MSRLSKKILIWGTGEIENQIDEKEINGEIIGYIQSKKNKAMYKEKCVFGIDEVPNDYDYIIVASSYTDEIYAICKNRSINMNKIIFLTKINKKVGITDIKLIKEVLGRNFEYYCARMGILQGTLFEENKRIYQQLNKRKNFEIKDEYLVPITLDKYAPAGTIGNYFWQDLWAARLIYKSGIKTHFDIGSRIDGFIAHLLSMEIDVTLIDIREFPEKVEGLHTIIDDATTLQQVPNESIESMSALCSLEHFGLGRYGDPIDPEACFRCFEEIQKKVKKGGKLYISLPIGKERVEFNAHRVFYPSTILAYFYDMKLEEFSCTAGGKIEYNVNVHKYDNDEHNGNYRYGMFYFTKL